jgi:mRNA interferase MazF
VFEARLDPVEGSEQAGIRPVIVVSRDAINEASPVVVVVPCTTFKPERKIYPSQVLLRAPEGGLRADSIALGEQVRAVAKSRLRARWGTVSTEALRRLERALLITFDLPSLEIPRQIQAAEAAAGAWSNERREEPSREIEKIRNAWGDRNCAGVDRDDA